MGDKSKIDKLFSDSLGDFEASPQTDSWAHINATMEKKQQKKRAAYWRWASVAAALVLAFYSGYYFNDLDHVETYPEPLNHSEQSNKADYISNEKPNTKIPTKEKTIISKSSALNEKPNQRATASTQALTLAKTASRSKNGEDDNEISSNQQFEFDANIISTEEDEILTPEQSVVIVSEPASPFEGKDSTESTFAELPENTSSELANTDMAAEKSVVYAENIEANNSAFSRFTLSAFASPTFPFTDVTINQADETTQDNVEQEKLINSYTYGIGLGYRISKNLELQTGFALNNWKQEATGVRLNITTSSITSTNTSVDANGNTSSGNVNFNGLTDPTNQGQLQTANIGGKTYSVLPGLKEDYLFIEIPITLAYYIVDSRRWYTKVNMGLNSRFVAQSEATSVYADGSEVPYNNFDLETYSIQLIAGLGAGVKLGPHWEFGLHPTLLYGITQVNKHSEVDTYFHQVLIYSCLSYRF